MTMPMTSPRTTPTTKILWLRGARVEGLRVGGAVCILGLIAALASPASRIELAALSLFIAGAVALAAAMAQALNRPSPPQRPAIGRPQLRLVQGGASGLAAGVAD